MPRRRTATNVLNLLGSFKKNPARALARSQEPMPSKTPIAAPRFLTEQEREAWEFIVARAPSDVLHFRDEVLLTLAARLFASILSRPQEQVESAELARMESMLSRLGMSPSDASRVCVPHGDQPNEFDEFC